MNMVRHEEFQALFTDRVLGELSSLDKQRVEEHLLECPECATEARELALTFEGIGLAEAPITPPAHLRKRVLDRLSKERRALPSRWTLSPVWLAAAAALVLVLGGLLGASLQRSSRLSQVLREVDDERARLAQQIAATGDQADRMVAILTAADLRRIDLAGFDTSRDATARAYWSATQGLMMVADRLPTPPPGRAYQVWLIGSSSPAPVSAGLIEGQSAGRGILIAPPPSGVSGGTVTVAVTDEPAGGLSAPTGSKHLVGSL